MSQMPFPMPMGHPPPGINPPPTMFGGFSPDGMSIPPELSMQMFPDPMLLDDANDPKRRRIARACDMCRKKKIKCDGRMPACSHCLNYKNECVFTQVEKKRTPPKGAKYIEGLENRLNRMESLLRLSGLLSEDDDTDLGLLERKLAEKQQSSRQASQAAASNPASPAYPPPGHFRDDDSAATPERSSLSPEPGDPTPPPPPRGSSSRDKPEEVEALSEMMDSLVTNQSGDARYTGSSSGFSIFSPRGIQWVSEKTGDGSLRQVISDVSMDSHKWTNWKPEIFADLFPRPVFVPLPPREEALSLLTDYFDNFNCMFPLFHRPTFMHLFEQQYGSAPYQGSGWWASLNVVLATAHRLRVMAGLVPPEEDAKSWAYLKNALGVYAELTMRNTDLLSVQALLCMAFFMQGTPNPQPTFSLLAAAIRLAHAIGLHRRGSGFALNPIEIEQRRRVFWIAYILDKDLCLRNGRPPAQDDDDMNVELPDADPEDGAGDIPLAEGKGKMNLFRVVCEFARIESSVYRRLYSAKAAHRSDGELLNTIGELDRELEDWKDRIPIDFRPEHEIRASHTPLMLHVVMLHFSYYNCLTTVHRMSVHHGYWTSRLSNYAIQGLNSKPLNPRIFSSAALCTAAARASISLLKYVPAGDASCVWMCLYFPVSALVTLFGHILQNPLDSRAQNDTTLMGMAIAFLHILGQEAETGGVRRIILVCQEFERIARDYIDKAEREQASRRKRKSTSQEPPGGGGRHPSPSPAAGGVGLMQAAASLVGSPPQGRYSSPPPTMHATPVMGGPLSSPNTMAATHRQQHPRHHQHHPQHQHQPSPQAYGSMSGAPPLPPSIAHPQEQQQQPDMQSWPSLQHFASGPDYMSFADLTGFGPNGLQSPRMDVGGGVPAPYRPRPQMQPLLPQDLTSLPMTLDWDWAEMSGGAYPSVENGNFAHM